MAGWQAVEVTAVLADDIDKKQRGCLFIRRRHRWCSIYIETGSFRCDYNSPNFEKWLKQKLVPNTPRKLTLLKPAGHVMHHQFNIQQL